MKLVRLHVFIVFLAAAALVGPPGLKAQPTLTVGDWVPPVTITNQTPLTLEYQVGGTTNIVEVTWVRQDGAVVSVANVDPTSAQPFTVDLPLGPSGDRVQVTWIGTVRDTLTNETAGGDRAATVIFDDVGPDVPNVTDPPLPYTAYSPTITLQGNVSNNPPAGGNTDTPETGGQVVIYDPATNAVLGGGIIQADSSFLASVDLSSLASGTVHNLSIHAVDPAGNVGTTGTVQLGYTVPPPPALSNLTITPPDGSLTNDPGVVVSGTVSGQAPPFTVNIFVDGLIQSQVAGLGDNESFNHTLTLPGEGPHTISIQALNSNNPPDFSTAQVLGTITLDRTPPDAPLILTPDPNVSPFITRADSFHIEGLSAERDNSTTDPRVPGILLSGPSGINFSPASPLPIGADGRFSTDADIGNLPDGTYTITLTTRDEAGNTGPESSTQIVFVRDTSAPLVEEVRVDGVVAPQSNPEIYVGQRSVRVSIRVNEDMPSVPGASIGQTGSSTSPMGLASSTLRYFDYVVGIVPGFDGPVDVTFSGGGDRAGNPLNYTVNRLFVVDTVPPEVVSVEPSEGTSVSASPERIRIRMNDPLSSAGTASGVDLAAVEVEVRGPVPGSNSVVQGALVPYDPVTLDFVPSAPLTEEGTYRVTITAVDKAGNRSNQVVRSFIFDNSAIRLSAANVRTNPPDGAFVNGDTIPGTAANPFVQAFIEDSQFDAAHSTIRVRDYCNVPPTVAGTQTSTGPANLTWTFRDPLPTDGSRDGVYTIELDVKDFAGNQAPTYITTFTYDTRAPSIERTFPSTDAVVRGPLRIVDATMRDARVDFCRQNSGVDRSLSTLELWLVTPNRYSGNDGSPARIPGTLRFISVGDIERVLLEIVDSNGYVNGLKTDGSDDGLYELRAEAFDRSGNRSGITTVRFTYDTQVPALDLTGLADGCTFTPPTVEFSGSTQDDRGGSGIDKVTVTLEKVDSHGYPTSEPPIFRELEASLAPLGLGPFDPDPPRREFTFSGDISQVTTTTAARLTVRAYDMGGNFTEKRYSVTVKPTVLPPPSLSSPASGASTASRLVTFRWNGVDGAAGYRLRVMTPNGNEVLRETAAGVTSIAVNLESYSDGDGRYTWTVAARDCSGRYGSYARSRILYIDKDRPRVLSVDITDPSPESNGSINEGEVRFTVRFSEPMDTTRPLEVKIHPQDVNAPVLDVIPMSYIGDTWTGRAFIPDSSGSEPDYNGLAVLSIRNGVDLGGNPMIEPNEGFTVFEIDTGPFFEIAMFQNPVNIQDVILVVKATTRRGGPPERLIDPLSVIVRRSGQNDQALTMRRLGDYSQAFRGTFFLDNRLATDLEFEISGTDDQGNTATRIIDLKVGRISASNGGIVIDNGRSMILSAGPGAVDRDSNIFIGSSSSALVSVSGDLPEDGSGEDDGTDSHSAGNGDGTSAGTMGGQAPVANGGELVLLAPLGAIEPRGMRLPGGVDLVVDLKKAGVSGLDGKLSGKAGLYVLEGGSWKHLDGERSDDTVTGRLFRTGSLAVMADMLPPRFSGLADGLKLGPSRRSIEIKVDDGGSGVDPRSLKARVDGRSIAARWEGDRSTLVVEPGRLAPGGGHVLEVEVADRSGNVSRASAALTAPPAFGFSEAVVFPNPARSYARIRYRLNSDADLVRAVVYDVSGHRVKSLAGSTSSAGPQIIDWDLTDGRGRPVSNGVYIIRLRTRSASVSRREDLRLAVIR